MEAFSPQLTNKINIKEENDRLIFCESEYIKNEDADQKPITNSTKENNFNEFNENNDIKNEICMETDNYDTSHNSDEDTTLSTIKNNKKSPLKASRKPKRQKTKTHPQKHHKIEPQNGTDTTSDALKQFTCLTCLNVCKSQSDLIKHYHDNHMLNKVTYSVDGDGRNVVYKCGGCGMICDSVEDMEIHLGLHNDERPLICKICGKITFLGTNLINVLSVFYCHLCIKLLSDWSIII